LEKGEEITHKSVGREKEKTLYNLLSSSLISLRFQSLLKVYTLSVSY